MAIVAIRGTSFGQYLKKGYNIVRRYRCGLKPDDDFDCFEHLGHAKTKKEAQKRAKKFSGTIEIREHKVDD